MAIETGPSAEFFQQLCDDISHKVGAPISVMGKGGVIVASSIEGRVGSVHPKAALIVAGDIDRADITADEAKASGVMLEGCNLPLIYGDVRIASVGVGGPLEQAKSFATLVQTCMNAFLAERFAQQHAVEELELKYRARTTELENEVEQRRQAERALRESEQRFRDIVDTASDWVWEMDEKLHFTYFSDRLFKLTGLTPEAALGRKRFDFIHPDALAAEPDKWTAHLSDLENRRPFYNLEYEAWSMAGKGCIFQISGKPVYDENGVFRGYRGVGREISDERRREKALSESEARMRRILERSPIGVGISHLEDGVLTYMNSRLGALLGANGGDLIGKSLSDYWVNPNIRSEFARTYLEKGFVEPCEVKLRKRDGQEFWGLVSWDTIYISGERRVLFWLFDISRQKETEAQLMIARDEAYEASRAKSQFLSSMSHELRTPLNSILGFGQLLSMNAESYTPRMIEEYLSQILRAGNHLLALINEVLDLARIEEGHVDLSMEHIDLRDVLQSTCTLMEPLARKGGIALIVQEDLDGLSVLADLTRLKQVLVNLLSNAVKYNLAGGRAEVKAGRNSDSNTVWIEVRDTGFGIAQEDLATIFDPFKRLRNHDVSEGTGIGLTVTRKLVELMNGSIIVESELKKGSCFRVILQAGEMTTVQSDINNVDMMKTDPSFKGDAKVLYVEDNSANMLLMEAIVQRCEGITLIGATTGEEGVLKAKQEKPQLILMDINLPGIDGFAALKMLKADPETADIPVIALSADAMEKQIHKGLDAGFMAYLTKPFNIGEIMQELKNWLKN